MKIQDMLLRRSWSAPFFIGLFALMAMSVAVGWDAWRDIFNIAYNDEEASHIFLVPIVALWLVWARRWRIRRIEPECSLWGPAVIIAGEFWRHAAEAAQLLGRRAILLTGRLPEQQPALPAGSRAFQYLPYSAVFPHAAAIVHQAGIGTLAALGTFMLMAFRRDRRHVTAVAPTATGIR